tara:strand:+ start:360 stop:890 length:531 start_codon:yes stop_codon:yes gene_type:complete
MEPYEYKIGGGAEGEVFIIDDVSVAKVFYEFESYNNEKCSLLKLKGVKGFCQIISSDDKSKTIIITRYICDIGQLDENLKDKFEDSICLQLSESVKYLHSHNMYHGDLSMRNIFCNYNDESIECFVGDFGLSGSFDTVDEDVEIELYSDNQCISIYRETRKWRREINTLFSSIKDS